MRSGLVGTHEGVRVAQAIINLALITGQIGRPGTGANSITGQCNAMGSRLVSNTTNLIGGYDFKSLDDRQHVASCLGIDPALIPTRDSWAYPEIIEGVRRGQIKALWVIATNTAHSWMDQNELRELWLRVIEEADERTAREFWRFVGTVARTTRVRTTATVERTSGAAVRCHEGPDNFVSDCCSRPGVSGGGR